MRNGTWVLVRRTSRPSSSSQPIEPWVSSWAWLSALRCCQVPLTVTSRCRERGVDVAAVARRGAPRRRCGRPRRRGRPGVRSGCSRGAPGRAGRLGVEDRRQHLVLDADAPARRLGGRRRSRRRRPRPAGRRSARRRRARGCRRGRRRGARAARSRSAVAGASRWVKHGDRRRRRRAAALGVDRARCARARAASRAPAGAGRRARGVERERLAALTTRRAAAATDGR